MLMNPTLSQRVIEDIVMPNGWHMIVRDSHGTELPEPIRGSTFRELLDNLVKFRVDNGLAIDTVQEDAIQYICGKYPHMCCPSNAHVMYSSAAHSREPSQDNESKSKLPLTAKMLLWLESTLENASNHNRDSLVSKSEAQRRADICRACPFNKPWNNSCSSCRDAASRLGTILRDGQDVIRGRQLGVCEIHGHDNRTAVWLKSAKFKPSTSQPATCWIKD